MSVVNETRQTRTRDGRTQSGRRSRVGAADVSGRARSASAQRAIDRRRKRLANAALTGASPERDFRPLAQRISLPSTSPVALARRIPFVFLVIGMLALGLALTLWLSTTAAQNSYQLSAAKQTNQDLQNRLQQIKKNYESGQSAPELAKKATEQLGMIPATNPPRLVVGPDGKVRVVGEVKPAQGPPAPSMDQGNSGAVNPGVNQQNKPAASNTDGSDPNSAAAAVPNFSNVLPGASAPTPAGQPAAPAGQTPAVGQSSAPAPAAQAPQQNSPQTGGAPTANSPATP
ncbi:hypothetical protein [Jongsikchunia kroppenstedtii]|uniref:hypothetical protein n=1 Tax=Jongsikchunia kroppenstedtii TaxID=1121721 RepID=UPI00037A6F9E|nr:hypothetical protein [Jongsikchunia kroppenstedtii]